MRKDPTAFRERFKAYKDGKSVKDIYDGGLPRYAGGKFDFSDDEAMDYILQLENPTREGYSKGIWRTPKDSSRFDIHQIGGGLDIREEHNPIVYNYLKSKGRLNDPWLTEAEERQLRMQTWLGKKALMDKFVSRYGDKISQLGYNTAAAMLWHGHPFKMMNNADSITGKAFTAAIDSGDKDLGSVFNTYYTFGSNAKRFASRINADAKFRKTYKPVITPLTQDSELIDQLKRAPKFQPWSNYHGTDYPINNPAPASVSSWNSPLSPAYTPTQYNSSLTYLKLPDIKDVVELTILKPRFKNGKLPGYEDGTSSEPDKVEAETLNQKKWLYNWLQNRSKQFANNIDTYNGQIYRGSNIDRFHVTPLPILNSIDRYRLHNARNIAKEQTDHANLVPIYDLRLPGQYLKAQDMSYNLLEFLLKKAGTQGAWFSPTYKNDFKDEEIFIAPERGNDGTLLMWDKSAPLHELVHAATSDYLILLAAIDKILGGYTTKGRQKYRDKYLDDSSEVYSRLMLFRYDNKLKPNQKITKQHIKLWKDNKNISDKQFIHRYDDDTLLKLFNEVATNSTQDLLFNRKGDGLFYASNGKSPIYIKPANRGKFTALKKRTGHSASWFKKNGTPAQKKMATFELNARKWSH